MPGAPDAKVPQTWYGSGPSISGMVEVLYWEGCPSHDEAFADVREVLAELGREDEPLHKRSIDTDEQALKEQFVGSPTIRVDGVDVFPPDEGELVGLSCRVYRLRDGRYSPTPDREDLREALERALAASAT
jgi:hypothetical protein